MNPPTDCCNRQDINELENATGLSAAPGQRIHFPECSSLASKGSCLQECSQDQSVYLPPAVARVADAWPLLPPHIREAIQTLVDAGVPTERDGSLSIQGDPEPASVVTDQTVWRMAQECRSIVQSCLREEEWQDADREFFEANLNGLAKV